MPSLLPGRATPANHVLFRQLDNEALLLDLGTGQYYGLNEVGSQLWQQLAVNPNLNQAIATLLAQYEVEQTQLTQDIAHWLAKLNNAGLLELTNS